MRKYIRGVIIGWFFYAFLSSILLCPSFAEIEYPSAYIAEEDGSPIVYVPTGIKFPNGTVIDNGDGTASVSVSVVEADPIASAINGILKSDGTTLSAATAGTDYYNPGGTDVSFADGGTAISSWTQYLIPYAVTTTSIGQIAIGTDGQILTSGGAGVAPSFESLPDGAIQFTFDGGGSAIAVDTTAWIYVPYTGTLIGWDLTVDTSATITIDLWDDSYANFPPTNADAMPGAGKEPTITAAVKATDADISDWADVAITKGEYLKVSVDSNDNATKCVLTLKVDK